MAMLTIRNLSGPLVRRLKRQATARGRSLNLEVITMKIVPVADVKARLSAYLDICAVTPVVVTRNGRPAAVLVAVSDEDDLERLILAHTPRFRAMLDAAEQRIKKGRVIGHRDFWRIVAERHQKGDVQRRVGRARTGSKGVRKTRPRVDAKPAARRSHA
jgi:prevent-host-death family protein